MLGFALCLCVEFCFLGLVEEDNLCLYAYPNETWDVSPPPLEVPSDIPEPVLGINYIRDGMQRKAWLQFVAGHCDSWLLYLAFFFGFRLNRDERYLYDPFTYLLSLLLHGEKLESCVFGLYLDLESCVFCCSN